MKKVWEMLQTKGHDVYSIEPGASVYEAIELMADKGIGALMVMEGSNLVGVLSERDYARKVILQGRSSRDTLIKDIMTTRIMCAEPQHSAEECMAMMTEKYVRHLPIMEGDKLVGVISIGDIVKSIIEGQQLYIDQLERFVRGG